MKTIIGILVMIFGAVLGLYLGVYVMFIGGIVDLINSIKDLTNSIDVSAYTIAFGIAKIILASFVGCISFYITLVFGISLIASDK